MDRLGSSEHVSSTCIPRFLLLRWDFGGEGERELEREGELLLSLAWPIEERGSTRMEWGRREREGGCCSKGVREWLASHVGPTLEKLARLTVNSILFSPEFLPLIRLSQTEVLWCAKINCLEFNHDTNDAQIDLNAWLRIRDVTPGCHTSCFPLQLRVCFVHRMRFCIVVLYMQAEGKQTKWNHIC